MKTTKKNQLQNKHLQGVYDSTLQRIAPLRKSVKLPFLEAETEVDAQKERLKSPRQRLHGQRDGTSDFLFLIHVLLIKSFLLLLKRKVLDNHLKLVLM